MYRKLQQTPPIGCHTVQISTPLDKFCQYVLVAQKDRKMHRVPSTITTNIHNLLLFLHVVKNFHLICYKNRFLVKKIDYFLQLAVFSKRKQFFKPLISFLLSDILDGKSRFFSDFLRMVDVCVGWDKII